MCGVSDETQKSIDEAYSELNRLLPEFEKDSDNPALLNRRIELLETIILNQQKMIAESGNILAFFAKTRAVIVDNSSTPVVRYGEGSDYELHRALKKALPHIKTLIRSTEKAKPHH